MAVSFGGPNSDILNRKLLEEVSGVEELITQIRKYVVSYSAQDLAHQRGVPLAAGSYDSELVEVSYSKDEFLRGTAGLESLFENFPTHLSVLEQIRTRPKKLKPHFSDKLAAPWDTIDSQHLGAGRYFGNDIASVNRQATICLYYKLMKKAQSYGALGVVHASTKALIKPNIPDCAQGYALILKDHHTSPHRTEQ